MKKILPIALAASLCCLAQAQKKPLDHSVYDSWQSIPGISVTDDGSVAAFQVNPQQGDGQLVLRDLRSGRELRIPRGGAASLTYDSKWAVFPIKAPYEATRKAKIKKKKPEQMPKDSLGYVNLETFELVKLPDAGSIRTSVEGPFCFTYETGKKDARKLVVVKPGVSADTLKQFKSYAMDRCGKRLAVVFKKEKKDSLSSDRVVLYNLATMQPDTLSEGKKFYGSPKFNDTGDKMVFLASADSNATGSRNCSLFLYEELRTGRGRKAVTTPTVSEIIPQGQAEGLPAGYGLTDASSVVFSRLSDRLFVNLGEILPPKDTTIIDFETAQLDIWNYDIYITPPMYKAAGNAGRAKELTYKATVDLRDTGKRLVTLSQSVTERISYIDGGEADCVLAVEHGPYLISSTWDENNWNDVALVSLRDGSRRQLFTKLNGSPSVSPGGKYLVWYDNEAHGWISYRLADGRQVSLTAGIEGIFHDDEDDHPMPAPAFDRPYWYDGDEALILTEKHDLYKVSPDGGKAVCLTGGRGRADDVRYRYTNFVRSDIGRALAEVGVSQTVSPKATIYLTTFDRTTKENGFATLNASKPGLIQSFTAPWTYSNVSKAHDAETTVYRKGNFEHPMDAYATPDFWQSEQKLSSINPQQADYNWGKVQLVHWTAYDGTKLDGLLITPEDLDPAKKYPMIAYFYEKNSQTLYASYSPSPSRSVINFPFYASRGYVVFIPDIVYVPGHPGESAYNCICSGVEAMCAQFGFIDKERMGIQGQSWGGYQTAYLVTRTDMFAAAGAGAPVGNMTSAYGGIRWGSGAVRAMQYEHGQSRIGKSLWDEGGLDLYIENSPVFHTENVTTPVLIMHNDKDGAVPWYQGIEFFMSLRRFGHPAWLLEYNNEEHNLAQRRNAKDLSVRLQQFFDHYLKGEPMPAWMKTGIPYQRKGQYFGFETAEQ